MFGKIKEVLFAPTVIEDKFDSVCFNLILFDIFFVPLFPWFSVSVSLPVIIYWYFRRKRVTAFEPERNGFAIIVFLMAISTIFSLIGFDGSLYQTDFVTSFKRFVQYITSFWYFFFFLYFFVKYKRQINNIVLFEIIYITLYALLYSFNQDAFVQLKQVLCPFDPQTKRWLDGGILSVYRFNYLLADPNNVAYAVTGLSLFYLIEEKISTLKKYIVLACLAYILLCTMSFGGIGVAIVLILYLYIFTDRMRSSSSAVIVGLCALVIIGGFVVSYIDYFAGIIESGIGQRQELYGNEGMAGGGGRWDDLLTGLGKFNPLFLIIGSGQEGFVTEIGHIYVWYMYGLPVYIYFMRIFFSKRKKQSLTEYLPIIPFFVGFTMNIAIGEQKFLLLLLLISAYFSAKSYNLQHQNVI